MRGIGGANFGLAAEHYMNLGWLGAAIFGGLLVLPLGLVVAHADNWPGRQVLVAVAATIVAWPLLSGVDSRLAHYVGSLGLSYIVPAAAVVAVVEIRRRRSGALPALAVLGLCCLALHKLFGGPHPEERGLIYFTAVVLGLLYVLSPGVLGSSRAPGSRGAGRNEQVAPPRPSDRGWRNPLTDRS